MHSFPAASPDPASTLGVGAIARLSHAASMQQEGGMDGPFAGEEKVNGLENLGFSCSLILAAYTGPVRSGSRSAEVLRGTWWLASKPQVVSLTLIT